MDICKSEQALKKQSPSDAAKPPLLQTISKHGTLRSQITEVSSRYNSPTQPKATGPRRCPSPNTSRISPTSTVSGPKRAISAERKRLNGPPSPCPSPSTPVQDISSVMLLTSKKTVSNDSSKSLRPSAMRSLIASFNSDVISVPVSEREKPISCTLTDRTLRPSLNIACKQSELPTSRKPTQERKSTPVKGKKYSDKSENSKPIDSLPARLVDQHRWPSTVNGKANSTALSKSISLTDKTSKSSSLCPSTKAESYPRRLSLDWTSKPKQKSACDSVLLRSYYDSGKSMLNGCSSEDCSVVTQSASSSSPDTTVLVNPATRVQSSPTPGSCPSAPPMARGISPARNRVGNPSSRGPSPARVRSSSPSRQSQSSTSVLSYIADIKKGNKAANHIEDVHQLRLLYNRNLQWQYANSRADAALRSQEAKAEKMLSSMWRTIVDLLDSVTAKRKDLQRLRLMLKLYSILDNHLTCLDQWALVERDHVNSLIFVVQDLQTCTICIPVTGGARGDIETIKAAVCSAVDVMQAMGSLLCSIFSQMEGMNSLVFKVVVLAAQERAMLDELESLLSITSALQVEEYSFRTHLFQLQRALRNGESAIYEFVRESKM